MQQMDMFNTSGNDFLFSEINKTQNSMNRQFRALFAIVTELQKKYNELKEIEKNDGDAL